MQSRVWLVLQKLYFCISELHIDHVEYFWRFATTDAMALAKIHVQFDLERSLNRLPAAQWAFLRLKRNLHGSVGRRISDGMMSL